MPHSQYIPSHEPPSRGDHLLARPFFIPLAWASAAVGGLLVLTTTTGMPVSRALLGMPWWIVGALAVCFLFCSFVAIRAGGLRRPNLSPLHRIEKEQGASLGLGCAWLAYVVVVGLSFNIYGLIPLVMSIAVAAGFFLYAHALRVTAKRVRAGKHAIQRAEG